MIRNDLHNERTSKKNIAIDDFNQLSQKGVLGQYLECELTHIFLVDKEKSICNHYFAVCNYEEFHESDTQLRDKKITDKLIKINEKYSLGIIQKRISTDESKIIFNQLCLGSFSLRGNTVLIPHDIQLLPKIHIPKYWDGTNVMLQKVLKPNFWGDTYIIEFLCLENPFLNTFSINDFDKINSKINDFTKVDLSSVNDRIGSFIFQFPITIISADCNIISDWCIAKLSLDIPNGSISSSDICTIVSTKLDDVITGFKVIEGIQEEIEFRIGDSNNFEYIIFNKNTNLIYTHFMGNYIRHTFISGNFNIQYSEPRTIPSEDGKTTDVEIFHQNIIMAGSKHDIDNRIHDRMKLNSIIKQSGDFHVFNMGQRQEALDYIREKIHSYSGSSSEIWLWDPYLRCKDIFDTLYYTDIIEITMKCITSFEKIKKLEKLYNENIMDFETFKISQQNEFSGSNNLGINLEFRSTYDQVGTKFHDRFIIFLPTDTSILPIVFSLGTSVNSLGTSHHIIQRTLDPSKIVYAFQLLWQELAMRDDTLIIKLP